MEVPKTNPDVKGLNLYNIPVTEKLISQNLLQRIP